MSQISARMPSRSMLIRITGTVIAFVLLFYLLSRQGWDEIINAIRQIPLWNVLFAFGLIMVSRIAVTLRWYILLRSSDMKLSYWQCFRITFAGLFASNFLPTTIGGDVVRLAGLMQHKFDAALSTASLIMDRLVGLAGMALALPFGLTSLFNAQGINLQITAFPILSATFSLNHWWKSVWEKFVFFVQQTLGAISIWLKKPQALGIALFITLIHMFSTFLAIDLLLTGMGEDIALVTIAGLYSLVYFITLLPFSINGYGLQELSMTFIFYGLAGVAIENSLSMALLLRTMVMVSSLPGAFFVGGMISSIGERNGKEHARVETD